MAQQEIIFVSTVSDRTTEKDKNVPTCLEKVRYSALSLICCNSFTLCKEKKMYFVIFTRVKKLDFMRQLLVGVCDSNTRVSSQVKLSLAVLRRHNYQIKPYHRHQVA